MKILAIAGAATAVLIALGPITAEKASAGPEHLKCQGGFKKVATYGNSIKCRRIKTGFPTKSAARTAARNFSNAASCNAHMSAPKKRVLKAGGKWKAQVSFICANIT